MPAQILAVRRWPHTCWLLPWAALSSLAVGYGGPLFAPPAAHAAEPASPKPAAAAPEDSPDVVPAVPVNAPTADGKGNGTSEDRSRPSTDDDYYELLTLFTNTLDEIDRNYVKEVNRRELMEAAIDGMLQRLDVHSSFIRPEGFEDLKTEVASEFGGLGIRISAVGRAMTVISPLHGSPAYKAGILAGDVILAIDGVTTDGMPIDLAVQRLKGAVGSTVSLQVRHALQQKEETISVRREIVRIPTILGYRRKPNHDWDYVLDTDARIGYVRITSFSRHTGEELQDVLARLQQQGIQSLILDLRFNPGGLLSAAIEVSDLFLARGRIVSATGRNVAARSWDAIDEGTFSGFRMAVLVNRFSASASEIVAAALQDHGRAAVVGERTWGKASVQNIIELEGGRSALKLTTAEYQRPSGKNIHRHPQDPDQDWGVMPEPNLAVTASEQENQSLRDHQNELDLLRGVPQPNPSGTVLSEQTGILDQKGSETDAANGAARFVDRQLQKAAEYLQVQYAQR